MTLKSFYDYEGEFPNKFIAIYGDGSGCEIYFNVYGRDKDWFLDAGYVWFITLPDDFKVWGEK